MVAFACLLFISHLDEIIFADKSNITRQFYCRQITIAKNNYKILFDKKSIPYSSAMMILHFNVHIPSNTNAIALKYKFVGRFFNTHMLLSHSLTVFCIFI